MIPRTASPIKTVWKNLPGYLCVVIVFISGCAVTEPFPNRDEYQLTSAFSGESAGCDQICWFGIQVGTTTRAQALEIIGKEAWIDQKTLEASDDTIKVSWFTETTKEYRGYTQLNLDAGVVDSVEITGLMPFTIGDFISLLGEPEEIGITAWQGGRGESLTSYVLYYRTRGLEIYVAVGSGDGPQSKDFASMVGTDLIFQGETRQQPWSGYGQLDKYLGP